jgi:pimeloyl-ACP methyl ester carboxylesterase
VRGESDQLVTEVAATRAGPIQYATIGVGRPVLVVHGTPGGCDQAAAMARFLPRADFRAILPSRPGYLATPLNDSGPIDRQADLLAALLDHLEIERVAVLCWSGGGPSSYRLAARHPDRITALVALAAVSKAIERPHEGVSERLLFSTRFGEWMLRMLTAHAPKQLISATLAAEGNLPKQQIAQLTEQVFEDEHKRRFVLQLDATITHRDRDPGLDNDWNRFAAIDTLALEEIRTRCLLVHGSVDTDVPPDHSEHAHATIPESELITLEGGTHLAFYTHPDATRVQQRAIELLSE